MAHRAFLGVMFGFGLAACAAVACGNYVPPDVGTYGPPNGLANNKAPEPPATNEDSGSGSSSSGGGSDAGGSSGGGTNYLCQQSGGTIVDGGTCSVSFANDIYPNMQATGTWACASSSCHGNTTTKPFMNGTTVTSFYEALVNFPLADDNSIPYVNPCSTDPTKSAFACNTIGATTTGVCGQSMPLGAAQGVGTADETKINTWVACGAPNN